MHQVVVVKLSVITALRIIFSRCLQPQETSSIRCRSPKVIEKSLKRLGLAHLVYHFLFFAQILRLVYLLGCQCFKNHCFGHVTTRKLPLRAFRPVSVIINNVFAFFVRRRNLNHSSNASVFAA